MAFCWLNSKRKKNCSEFQIRYILLFSHSGKTNFLPFPAINSSTCQSNGTPSLLVKNNRFKAFKVIHLPFFTPMQTFPSKVYTHTVSGLAWILLLFLRHSKETKHRHFPLSTSMYLSFTSFAVLRSFGAGDSPGPPSRKTLFVAQLITNAKEQLYRLDAC